MSAMVESQCWHIIYQLTYIQQLYSVCMTRRVAVRQSDSQQASRMARLIFDEDIDCDSHDYGYIDDDCNGDDDNDNDCIMHNTES